MMLGIKGENLRDVERFLTATLEDPAGNLSMPAQWFFNFIPQRVFIDKLLNALGHSGPTVEAGPVIIAPKINLELSWIGALLNWGSGIKQSVNSQQLLNLISNADFVRDTVSIPQNEKATFMAHFAMYRDAPGQDSVDRWAKFCLQFISHEGKARLVPNGKYMASPHLPLALQLIRDFYGAYLPTYQNFIIEAAQDVVIYERQTQTPLRTPVPAHAVLNSGSKWFDAADFSSSATYNPKHSKNALVLGVLKDTQQPVFYPHNESLVTIGGSGTGKSQAHVVINLLTYAGAVFVLDVKGELWEKTAGYRQKTFGPCFRFSPTHPDGRSHRYNPFHCISTVPDEAAEGAAMFASCLVGEAQGDNKYWQNRAKDFIWAFTTLIAIDHSPQTRNVTALSKYLSLQTNYPDLNSKEYRSSDTAKVVNALRKLAARTGIVALDNSANSIESGLSDNSRLESVLDTARQYVDIFATSPTVSAAISESDWNPLDLRRPGTSVYISLSPGQLQTFAPIVRVIFQQHATTLLNNKSNNADDPPVTFFLDEMPQLGKMPGLTDLLDLGRSAGIRMWLFAQYFGQFKKAYEDLASGIITGSRITSWMKPDSDGYKLMSSALGTSNNYFTKERKSIAEESQLRGPEFRNDIVTLSPGEHPLRLSKILAYEHAPDRMRMPPPIVPLIP